MTSNNIGTIPDKNGLGSVKSDTVSCRSRKPQIRNKSVAAEKITVKTSRVLLVFFASKTNRIEPKSHVIKTVIWYTAAAANPPRKTPCSEFAYKVTPKNSEI